MNAYIAVTPKQRANVPINSVKKDPILAEWQYGLGTTLAFTSDVTGKWSGEWASWPNWPQFLNQVVSQSLPQYDSEPFHFSIGGENGQTIVHLKEAEKQYLPLDIAVVSQDGKEIDTNSKPIAPGEFEVIFPNKPGMYFLRVKQTDQDGQIKLFKTGFSVPYSDEYILKGTNKQLLQELATTTGGKELKSPKDAFRPLKEKPQQKEPITQPLLLAAFLLLVLEIFIRRLGFHPFIALSKIVIKNRKKSEPADSLNFQQITTVKKKVSVERKRKFVENGSSNAMKEETKSNSQEMQNQAKRKPSIPDVSIEGKEDRIKRLLETTKRKKP